MPNEEDEVEKLDWKYSLRVAARHAHEEGGSLSAFVATAVDVWEKRKNYLDSKGPARIEVDIEVFLPYDSDEYREALLDETREYITGSGYVEEEIAASNDWWRFSSVFEDWSDDTPALQLANECLHELRCFVGDLRWYVKVPESLELYG